MAVSRNPLVALEWNRSPLESYASDGGSDERERCIFIHDCVANFARKKRKLRHVQDNVFVRHGMEEPVEYFPDGLYNLYFFSINSLAVDDVVALLMLFDELQDHFRGVFTVHVNKNKQISGHIP